MKKIGCIAVLLISFFQAHAQVGGQHSFNFLELKLSPTIAALQGATIAQPTDNSIASVRNPALLNSGMMNRLSLAYNNYLSDINFGNVAYAFKFKDRMYHTGVHYVNYGQFAGFDVAGNPTGTFTADDYSFYVGTTHKLNERWTAGGNLKAIYSQLSGFFASAAAIDLGLQYQDSSETLHLGFVVRNLGVTLKNYTEGEQERLPLRIEAQFSKRLPHTPFRFNVLLHNLQQFDMRYSPRDGSVNSTNLDGDVVDTRIGIGDNIMRHFTVGTEVILGKYTHVRVGYNHQMRRELSPVLRRGLTGFAWGFGVQLWNVHFNYASSAFFPGINTNQFSAVFNLKSIYQKKSSVEKNE